MLKHIKKWFSKDSADAHMHVPADEYAKFVIMVNWKAITASGFFATPMILRRKVTSII